MLFWSTWSHQGDMHSCSLEKNALNLTFPSRHFNMVSDLDPPTQHGTFSTNQTASIKVGSTLLSVSKGAPQGYNLPCTPTWRNPLIFITFADDTVLLGLIRRGRKASRGCPTWGNNQETKGAFFWTQTSQRSSHGPTTQSQQRLFLACVHHCSFENVLTWPIGRAAALQLREALQSLQIYTLTCPRLHLHLLLPSERNKHLWGLFPTHLSSVWQHRNTPQDCSLFIHCAAVKSNSDLHLWYLVYLFFWLMWELLQNYAISSAQKMYFGGKLNQSSLARYAQFTDKMEIVLGFERLILKRITIFKCLLFHAWMKGTHLKQPNVSSLQTLW